MLFSVASAQAESRAEKKNCESEGWTSSTVSDFGQAFNDIGKATVRGEVSSRNCVKTFFLWSTFWQIFHAGM